MKLKSLKKKILAATLIAVGLPVSAQVEVNYEKYPDYAPPTKGDAKLMVRRTDSKKQRPAYVNNAETKYFPSIFNQDGGSCGSASRISYMFNYEINAYRDADASLEENIYPSHFTWLLTNSGSSKDGMAIANGIPNIVTYGGRTYSNLFGNQDCADNDFGWMQGYDKWYAAMFNRLERTTNFPQSVETEEGREAVKNWLWNHNGDEDFKAGGICGIGVASGGTWLKIPRTEKNSEIGVVNKYYVGKWGAQVDHALTIVGYDDRIEFDLDGNGIAGEVEKDEVGAWIIANSWGDWCNKGFIYCPYKNAVTVGNGTDYYWPEVYYIRKDYRPIRTMKIKMEHKKRSEILLSAGIASDTSATTPEKIINFEHFKYAGDGDGDGQDALTPMLGRWKDGLHHEPMEFGYDLTDLSANFDTRRPLKYFFIVQTKVSATGAGKIHECSVIDYEFDKNGVEFPCDIPQDGVKVKTLGGKTIISVVVTGEPLNAPRNIVLEGNTLIWDAPVMSTYSLLGYNVYSAGELVARVAADVTSYTAENLSSVKLAAIYSIGGSESESAYVSPSVSDYCGATPETNATRGFQYSGFAIEDLFTERYPAATIEYWLKPNGCVDYNQQIGPGWGNFMLHTTARKELYVGWDTGNRITSPANTLTLRKWNHIAIVVNGSTMTAYVNGENVGEIASGGNGIGGFGTLTVGGTTSATGINGTIDEFRVWKTARSQKQIQTMMHSEVADPQNNPDLLVEVKMDVDTNDELIDATGKYKVTKLAGRHIASTDNALMVDTRELSASFVLPGGPYYNKSSIRINNTSSANALKYEWNVDGKKYTVEHPEVVFETAGDKKISLTVYDMNGKSVSCEQNLTVEELPAPVASFKTVETAVVGQRVSFVNTTVPSDGCKFSWSMPGAEVETATTVNASATFAESGFYTVTLNATNAAGTSTVSKTIIVGDVTPEVDFEIKPATIYKGETVSLIDASKHAPNAWHWAVYNSSNHFVSYEQNCEMTFDNPGIYNVELRATNMIGTGVGKRENAIVVCNAESKTGLNFRGETTETVTFDNPINLSVTPTFTIDWWMNPKRNATYSQAMGGSMENMLICALSDGTLSFSIGGYVYTSQPSFYKQGEWHHYALVFDRGLLKMYRDGEYFQSIETVYTRMYGKYPNMPEKFVLGGAKGAMNAVIDEFRIWNSALTNENIVDFANSPIEDIAAAEKSHKLALYYNFNQNSGNVQDATSNALTGVRSGFGPEGDAWSSSLGVFCLNNVEREDITENYLTNYEMPFLHSGKSVNDYEAGRYMEILQNSDNSTWVVENATVNGKVKTGLYVDVKNNSALALTLKDYDFEGSVQNHKLYQTVKLPAGHYVFRVEDISGMNDDESYIVVNEGVGLPDTDDLEKSALASSLLPSKMVEFSVQKAENTVSLGLLMNTRGARTMQIKGFYLEKKNSNDDFVWAGVDEVVSEENPNAVQVNVRRNAVEFVTSAPRRVTVFNVYGAPVYDAVVDGVATLVLPNGIYVIEGNKFMVR